MSSAQRKANIDVNGSDNVVPMHRSVKKEFDQLRFCIIPEGADVYKVGCNPGCTRHRPCTGLTGPAQVNMYMCASTCIFLV